MDGYVVLDDGNVTVRWFPTTGNVTVESGGRFIVLNMVSLRELAGTLRKLCR